MVDGVSSARCRRLEEAASTVVLAEAPQRTLAQSALRFVIYGARCITAPLSRPRVATPMRLPLTRNLRYDRFAPLALRAQFPLSRRLLRDASAAPIRLRRTGYRRKFRGRYAKVSSFCLERISSKRTWKTGNSFYGREPLKPSNGSHLFLALRV